MGVDCGGSCSACKGGVYSVGKCVKGKTSCAGGTTAVESEQELLQTSMESQDDNASADVLVACLRRADFLESCHGVGSTPQAKATCAIPSSVQGQAADNDADRMRDRKKILVWRSRPAMLDRGVHVFH